jgi:hypothetical protein
VPRFHIKTPAGEKVLTTKGTIRSSGTVNSLWVGSLHEHDEAERAIGNRSPDHHSRKGLGSILQFFGHMDGSISTEKRRDWCNYADKRCETSWKEDLVLFEKVRALDHT